MVRHGGWAPRSRTARRPQGTPAMDLGQRAPQPEGGQLARKINHLIATLYPDERSRPGFAKLAQKIRESTGSTISSTYLWELATGKKHNLTQGTLTTLAEFF